MDKQVKKILFNLVNGQEEYNEAIIIHFHKVQAELKQKNADCQAKLERVKTDLQTIENSLEVETNPYLPTLQQKLHKVIQALKKSLLES